MSLTPAERAQCCRVVLLCVVWYTISSANNIVGKTLLNYFPYPMTLSMVQLLSITVYSEPTLRCLTVRRHTGFSWPYYLTYILPLAFGKFLAVLMAHVSIWKVPLSYAHTVKATMPLFTVVLGRILLGEKQTTTVYCSLIPIICGVGLATITELSFDVLGLLSALLSTAVFSVMQLYSKKAMKDSGIHHLRLLHLLGRLAFVMFIPIWLLFDFRKLLKDDTLGSGPGQSGVYTLLLLATDGFLSWLQNIVAFTVLHLVSPLTYAVCNATKRIAVITASLLLLRNPVTPANVLGMAAAIGGVFLYNKAKYEANKQMRSQAILPVVDRGPAANPLLKNTIDWADKVSPIYRSDTSAGHHPGGYYQKQQNGYHPQHTTKSLIPV